MPPIVTNIGSPKDTWIRLEASIVFDAKTVQHPETLAEDIAGDELAYLRTVALAQVEGPIGLENIRQDLNERAAIRSGGKVSELVIRTLVCNEAPRPCGARAGPDRRRRRRQTVDLGG